MRRKWESGVDRKNVRMCVVENLNQRVYVCGWVMEGVRKEAKVRDHQIMVNVERGSKAEGWVGGRDKRKKGGKLRRESSER